MNIRIPLCASLAIAMMAGSVRADLLSEVPKVAQDELADGQMVVKTQTVSGAPWPRVILYQVVNAPVKVIWDLFNDLDAASSYTPNLISADVIAQNGNTKDVRYTVKVPVLMRISYVVRNTYIKKKDGYEIDWTLIQSPLAKSSDGSLRVEPYGQNRSLICYTNLCVPITNLVAGLKNQALNEAKTTVRAITTEAERRAGN